ncbi:MAG: AsnC family transcriptional regulator [Rubrivivax sp.]|nr:AsnC family transcriptional regulator [Rubrivivax sp.]TXI20041.1 MAG: Lrp/AsnC family transcriptional regulator [Ottowia sp.]
MAADTHRDAPRLPADIDLQDARLIDRLQRSVPLTERPFSDLGTELGLSEAAVLDRLTQLLGSGVLTRLGPLYQIERAGGQFILAALQVPQQRYAEVTAQVNALPEVAHNYRREHALNMWFVVAAETPAVAWATCDQIEAATGLPVHAFPKEREYFVGLYLPLLDRPDPAPPAAQAAPAATALVLTEFDRALIAATQSGLPLVPRPYDAVAAMLGSSSAAVRERLAALLAAGVVRRIAAVPNHYRLGYTANGMSVWDVDDAEVDRLGELLGSQPGVSHCYRRPRKPGVWRYNLFAMLHGHSREQVLAQAEQVAALLGPACRAHDVLFSSAILKKTGLRLRQNV